MISFIRGRLVGVEEGGRVVVEVGGVGLQVQVPGSTVRTLPGAGEPICLHTHLSLREDGASLFGFATHQERELFERLLTVTGVGPRVALAVLSGCEPTLFWRAVREENPGLLVGVPGVGRKIAQRLIMELRDKVPPGRTGEERSGGARLGDGRLREAEEALTSLGYTGREAAEAVTAVRRDLPEGADTDQIVAAALRLLGR